MLTMCDFDKNHLFKQVNNSQLDEMNYNLWRKASLDATSSSSSNSSSDSSPVALIDSLLVDSNLSPASSSKSDDIGSLKNFSINYPDCSTSSEKESPADSPVSCSSVETALTPSPAKSYPSPTSGALSLSPSHRKVSSSHSGYSIVDNLCTLHMDMTYDDRIFFGVHNFYQLKRSLCETQCNIDFSAPDNKVSVIGQVPNVQKMCEMFISNSTLALQFEFKFFDEKYLDYMKTTFVLFHQQCEAYHKVFVTYRRTKPNIILFNFLSFRNNGMGLIRAMMQLKNELEFCQIGEFIPSITSTLQIPANRRDLTGRSNFFIDQIQTKTHTKIEVVRYEECPQYPFENVIIIGQTIPSVIQARFELVSRFTYELKFQVTVKETRPLVDYISKLSNDLKSVYISIEPCHNAGSYSKIIAINGNEKSISKLFTLRNQLIEEVIKCNGLLPRKSLITQ